MFVVDEKKHPQFERDGNDLVKTVVVDLHEALLGTSVFVTTLDGKSISVDVPEIVDPKYVKVLVGEGMPLSKSPNTKGDLKIKFDIRFPKELSAGQREQHPKSVSFGCRIEFRGVLGGGASGSLRSRRFVSKTTRECGSSFNGLSTRC